ncbi:MAG: flagellar type III secretion system protein FliR [Clostridiales bacterium]|jgi:flagellar biosynthetic protein FliR|nr:flagellar type III secretion system protein FliR [Clostridiales bacterium]
MNSVLELIFANFDIMLLVLARISGIVFVSVIFGRRNVPAVFYIGLIVSLTFILVAYYPLFERNPLQINSYIRLGFLAIRELAIGAVIGYISLLMFSALLLAGQLIDTHIGFGVVNVLDPHHNIQIPLIGNFYNVLALVLFFAMNGHHSLIRLLVYSYEVMPPGKVSIDSNISIVILGMFIEYFVLGVKLAVPVIASAFLAEVVFGILIRVMPQMNIFIIGLPFKILLGLAMLFFMIPVYVNLFEGVFDNMLKAIRSVIQGMGIQ